MTCHSSVVEGEGTFACWDLPLGKGEGHHMCKHTQLKKDEKGNKVSDRRLVTDARM